MNAPTETVSSSEVHHMSSKKYLSVKQIRAIANGPSDGPWRGALLDCADLLEQRSVETSAERNLGNILAVIHGDGGHYQAKHGDDKATEDAIAKYYAYPSTDKDAFSQFAEYIAREMPEGTVIGDPAWWAPRLWRFARYAFEQGQGDAYKPECAPAKATRAQTGQLSPTVQSPSETTAEHICGTPDAMCDMDCVERAYRPPPVLTIKFRPLLVSGSYGESPNGPVILIDSEQPPEQQLTAMWHEVLHLVLAALGRAHDENWIETMALRIAAACPDLLTQPRATEKATEQSSAPANQLALEPVPPAPGSVAGAESLPFFKEEPPGNGPLVDGTVTCPHHGVLMAFGDSCWECEKEQDRD